MLVSPDLNEVRHLVENIFQRLGVDPAEFVDMLEVPKVDEGRCIARSYRLDRYLAMWLIDVGILQFYDDEGRMLYRTNLFSDVKLPSLAA
jgi:hypothetical protein